MQPRKHEEKTKHTKKKKTFSVRAFVTSWSRRCSCRCAAGGAAVMSSIAAMNATTKTRKLFYVSSWLRGPGSVLAVVLRLMPIGAVLLSFACQATDSSKASSSGQPAPGNLTIAVIPKGTSHVFWQSIHAGANQAAQELGVTVIWRG